MRSITFTTSAGTEIQINYVANDYAVDLMGAAIGLLDSLEQQLGEHEELFDRPIHVPFLGLPGRMTLDFTYTEQETEQAQTQDDNQYNDLDSLIKSLPFGKCDECGENHAFPYKA